MIAWFGAFFFRSVSNRRWRVDKVGGCGACFFLCHVSDLAFNDSQVLFVRLRAQNEVEL
jgi:hypothetical protein